LLAQGRWFSPGTPASFTTKTGCHDIAEILLKVALNTKIQIHEVPESSFLFISVINNTPLWVMLERKNWVYVSLSESHKIEPESGGSFKRRPESTRLLIEWLESGGSFTEYCLPSC
jgi:hypothetical protein